MLVIGSGILLTPIQVRGPDRAIKGLPQRGDQRKGSGVSAWTRHPSAPTVAMTRRSIPAPCPRPFSSSLVPRTPHIQTSNLAYFAGSHLLIERESYPQCHLVVAHPTILDVPPGLDHLEPPQVSHCA